MQSWYLNTSGITTNEQYICFDQPNPEDPSNFSVEVRNDTAFGCPSNMTLLRTWYWNDPFLNDTFWAQYHKDPTLLEDWWTWGTWDFWPSVANHYRCTQDTNGFYQWGFSTQWLMIAAILNSVFLFGLWILWVDCDLQSELCRKGRRLGVWRAVADISEAMREELGPDICAYDEWELNEALSKKKSIKYYADAGDGAGPGHIGLSSRKSGQLKLEWDHEYGGKDQ